MPLANSLQHDRVEYHLANLEHVARSVNIEIDKAPILVKRGCRVRV